MKQGGIVLLIMKSTTSEGVEEEPKVIGPQRKTYKGSVDASGDMWRIRAEASRGGGEDQSSTPSHQVFIVCYHSTRHCLKKYPSNLDMQGHQKSYQKSC